MYCQHHPDEALDFEGKCWYCTLPERHPDGFFVNVYEYDRAYGGPEEGGWWFDTGTPLTTEELINAIEDPAIHPSQGDTLHYKYNKHNYLQATRMRDILQDIFPQTGRASSVLGGEDYLVRIEDHPPAPFPESRPHYE